MYSQDRPVNVPIGHVRRYPPPLENARQAGRMYRTSSRTPPMPARARKYPGAIDAWRHTERVDFSGEPDPQGVERVYFQHWISWDQYRVAWSHDPEVWDPSCRSEGSRYVSLCRRRMAASAVYQALSPDLAVQCFGRGHDALVSSYLEDMGVDPAKWPPRQSREEPPKVTMFDVRELRFTQIQRFGRRSKTDAEREAEQLEAFRALQNKGKKTVAEMLAETRVAKQHAQVLEVCRLQEMGVDVFGDGAPDELTLDDVDVSIDGTRLEPLEDIQGGFRILVPEPKGDAPAPPVPAWLESLKKY